MQPPLWSFGGNELIVLVNKGEARGVSVPSPKIGISPSHLPVGMIRKAGTLFPGPLKLVKHEEWVKISELRPADASSNSCSSSLTLPHTLNHSSDSSHCTPSPWNFRWMSLKWRKVLLGLYGFCFGLVRITIRWYYRNDMIGIEK